MIKGEKDGSDVVHDRSAFLAEKMIEYNKEKNRDDQPPHRPDSV